MQDEPTYNKTPHYNLQLLGKKHTQNMSNNVHYYKVISHFTRDE